MKNDTVLPVSLSTLDQSEEELATLQLMGYDILDLPSDLVDSIINSDNQ